jgi:hypothetical protein
MQGDDAHQWGGSAQPPRSPRAGVQSNADEN